MLMQIEFWRTDHPKEKRTSDIIVRRWRPCRPLDGDGKTAAIANEVEIDESARGRGEKVTGVASNLWPFSSITAVVRVLNGAHRGPPSVPVVFNTSEGGRCFDVHYCICRDRRSVAAGENLKVCSHRMRRGAVRCGVVRHRGTATQSKASGVNTFSLFKAFDERGADATQRDASGVNATLDSSVAFIDLSQPF